MTEIIFIPDETIFDTTKFSPKILYDFIYVDASHNKDLVLTDAILSFDLLVEDGLMIFDDYGWGDCKDGIDAFLNCFDSQIEVFYKDWQVYLRKL